MRRNKLWNARFVHLLLVEAVFQFATYLLNPGDLQLRGAAWASSLAVGGFVAGLVASAALAMRPFTGWIADKLSKTTLLVMAAALFSVAAFGCATVSSVFWIGVFRVVQGVAFAFRSAVVVSLVSVVVSQDHCGKGRGMGGRGDHGVLRHRSFGRGVSWGPRVRATTRASSFRDGCSWQGLVLAVLFKLPKDVRTHHKAAQEQAREAKAARRPARRDTPEGLPVRSGGSLSPSWRRFRACPTASTSRCC